MNIYKFNEIDSTNNFLKDKKDLKKYDIAIAKTQTAGRGRRGNTWKSMEGAALFSFAIEEEKYLDIEEMKKLSLIVGISVLRGLKKIKNNNYKFKWTNDIYINDKKLSGILVEKITDFFVIGIGINVNNTGFDELEGKATSLFDIDNEKRDVEEIIFEVIRAFKRTYSEFLQGGWLGILKEINTNNYLKGRKVNIDLKTSIETGIAREINENGTLQIELNGNIKNYDVGEIHIFLEEKEL